MMLKKIKNTPEDIFGIEMSGKIAKQEYEKIDVVMEHYKNKHGHFKFLVIAKDFKWKSFGAMWEDFKLGLKHFKYIEKAAIITNVGWIENSAKVMNPVIPNIPIKTFDLNEMEKAVQWLRT